MLINKFLLIFVNLVVIRLINADEIATVEKKNDDNLQDFDFVTGSSVDPTTIIPPLIEGEQPVAVSI